MLHVPLRRCAIKGERIERWQRRMCKTQGCVLILRLRKGGIISPGRRLISPVFSTIIRARSSLRYLFCFQSINSHRNILFSSSRSDPLASGVSE